MFMGIVEGIGKVCYLVGKFYVEFFFEVKEGDSVVVNGVCFIVVFFDGKMVVFDVGEEIFVRINLREVKVVNLERVLFVNGCFDGYIVIGYVDGMIRFIVKRKSGNMIWMVFEMLREKWGIVEKGLIVFNGVFFIVVKVEVICFWI